MGERANIGLFFVGSDDVPAEAKVAAGEAVNAMLDAGWLGFNIVQQFSLEEIAEAHEHLEGRRGSGRVLVAVADG